jgi:integrase
MARAAFGSWGRSVGRFRSMMLKGDEGGNRSEQKPRRGRKLMTALALRDAGKLDPHESRVKLDELAESYKTYAKGSRPKSHRWIELVWRVHLEPFFGGMMAERLTSDHIQSYMAERLSEGAATSTVNHELTVLRAMLNHGLKADPPKVRRVVRFPQKLREPNPRAGFVTDEEYDALQANAKYTWLRGVLAVAYTFGFRRAEVLGLQVSQVDLKARTIRLLPGTTKNDKGRVVVMTDEVFDLIFECVKDKTPSEPVFMWANGRPVTDFRRTWRTLAKKAGMPDLIFHDMRRNAVRNMVRGGVSKNVAKQISGHSTDSVFDRYDIRDEADLVEATRKMQARRDGHRLGTPGNVSR